MSCTPDKDILLSCRDTFLTFFNKLGTNLIVDNALQQHYAHMIHNIYPRLTETTKLKPSIPVVYALMRLLRDAALGVLRNRIEHSLLHFFDTSIKTTVSKLRGRERRETIVAHLSDIGTSRAVVAVNDGKTVDESTVWTIREDSTPNSSNPVPVPVALIDSKAAKDATKTTDDSYAKNAFADWVDGGEYVHVDEEDTDVLKSPLARSNITSVDTSHKNDVGKDRVGAGKVEKVESIANMNDKKTEEDQKKTVMINQNTQVEDTTSDWMVKDQTVESTVRSNMDIEDTDDLADKSRRDDLAMMMGLDASSIESESDNESENENVTGGHKRKFEKKVVGGTENDSGDKVDEESNQDDLSVVDSNDSYDDRLIGEEENDDMSDDECSGRNISNFSDNDDRKIDDSNEKMQSFLNTSNHCVDSQEGNDENAHNNIEMKSVAHRRKDNCDGPDTGYNSDEELCLATVPKGTSDHLKGRNPSDRTAKEMHEAAAIIFISAVGLRTVSLTFTPLTHGSVRFASYIGTHTCKCICIYLM